MACDDLCLALFKCLLVRGFRSGVEEHFIVELHYRANRRHLILDHSLGGAYAFMEWQGERIYYQCDADRCDSKDVKAIVDQVIKVKRLEGFIERPPEAKTPIKCDCLQSPAHISRALERVVHLSAADAARALDLSLRAFKRQLRAVGIDYWPGRMACGLMMIKNETTC